jgi:hypothetical protein
MARRARTLGPCSLCSSLRGTLQIRVIKGGTVRTVTFCDSCNVSELISEPLMRAVSVLAPILQMAERRTGTATADPSP